MRTCLIAAVLGVLAPSAPAQTRAPAELEAADPSAAVPPATYRSAFDSYVPYREQSVEPWRELNDDAARAGGHMGIFRGMGHAPGTRPAPSKPASGTPAASATEAGGQVPARRAPAAPAGKPAAGH